MTFFSTVLLMQNQKKKDCELRKRTLLMIIIHSTFWIKKISVLDFSSSVLSTIAGCFVESPAKADQISKK